MKLKNTSRRKFIKDSSRIVLSSGAIYGLDNLFNILINNSIANATTDTYQYKHVSFLTPGGPPRWYFDQPLNPNNDGTFVDGNFGTVLKNINGMWQATYAANPVKFGENKLYMPPVWSLKSASSNQSFADLLNETIMIRGLDMEINSHPINEERTIRPFNSNPSISGLVAQLAKKPITSIGHSSAQTTTVYKSPDGSANISVPRGNPISGIIGPFKASDIIQYKDLKHSIKQAVSAIDKYAQQERLPSQGTETTLKNTYEMFASKLDTFAKQFADLVKKYEEIIDLETAALFPEVTSDLKSIKPNGSKEYQYTSNLFFKSGDNLFTILQKANRPQLAQSFAFAEFALKEDLTASLTLDLGINFSNIKGVGITHDQHFVGSISSIIFTSLYFRSLLGCMLELKSALQTSGIWDKTVFQFTSEFSRTPRKDGLGSDHGFNSGSMSIMSGMIKQPGLIGNIYTTPSDSMSNLYGGTYGDAAPFLKDAGNNRPIINDDVVSTICEMLQIPKIGTKGQSLVKNSDGAVRLLMTDHKNIKRL
ncbi:MAG: DUF1501 domain-containing protein [Bdellovibrionaceae bacterium]|nr:DUF1501 domain-containing protein [Pseudobdellovibrionaceae bacterium]